MDALRRSLWIDQACCVPLGRRTLREEKERAAAAAKQQQAAGAARDHFLLLSPSRRAASEAQGRKELMKAALQALPDGKAVQMDDLKKIVVAV